MNKSKKRMNKRYIRYKREKKSLQKNRKQAYSKKIFNRKHRLRKKIRSRIVKKKRLNRRKHKGKLIKNLLVMKLSGE